MPEGHSLLRAARLWETVCGEELEISSPQGRFSQEAFELSGHRLLKAESRGKHLFLHFHEEKIVHIHLALYGKHYVHLGEPPRPRETVRLRVKGESKTIDLTGPAVCELLTHSEYEKVLDRLGPDPLKLSTPPDDFLETMSKLKRPIGQVLMEQNFIAGIGNVYRAEVLFLRGLNPYGATELISSEEWKELWRVTRTLMLAGAELKGPTITVLPGAPKPLTLPSDSVISADRKLYVYKQTGKPCVACGAPVKSTEFHGRTLYWCEVCQIR